MPSPAGWRVRYINTSSFGIVKSDTSCVASRNRKHQVNEINPPSTLVASVAEGFVTVV